MSKVIWIIKASVNVDATWVGHFSSQELLCKARDKFLNAGVLVATEERVIDPTEVRLIDGTILIF